MRYKFLILYIVCFLFGCSNLVDDIYRHTQDESDKEAQTAFFALSNIELNQEYIDKIKSDYRNDNSRRFLYEYLLSKRTQEEEFILSFIKNSEKNSSILLGNTSKWVSIANPTLELLSIYSTTNDDALKTLIKLALKSDGGNLSYISSNLRELHEINPERIENTVKDMKLNMEDILLLMEDE